MGARRRRSPPPVRAKLGLPSLRPLRPSRRVPGRRGGGDGGDGDPEECGEWVREELPLVKPARRWAFANDPMRFPLAIGDVADPEHYA